MYSYDESKYFRASVGYSSRGHFHSLQVGLMSSDLIVSRGVKSLSVYLSQQIYLLRLHQFPYGHPYQVHTILQAKCCRISLVVHLLIFLSMR